MALVEGNTVQMKRIYVVAKSTCEPVFRFQQINEKLEEGCDCYSYEVLERIPFIDPLICEWRVFRVPELTPNTTQYSFNLSRTSKNIVRIHIRNVSNVELSITETGLDGVISEKEISRYNS